MKKGFTLLELLITIIILGILAAIAIPNYINSVEQRKGEACISNIRAILAAWQIYNMKNNPDYARVPVIFYPINTINSNLGIMIDEDNFGQRDEHGDAPGFYMGYVPPPNPYYNIHAYRLSGQYNNSIIGCDYFPNGSNGDGTGIYYDWQTSVFPAPPWPWMPPDE